MWKDEANMTEKAIAIVTQLERAGAQTMAGWMEAALLPEVDLETFFLYDKSGSDVFEASRCLAPARPTNPTALLRLAYRLFRLIRNGPPTVIAHTHYAILATIIASVFAGRRINLHAVHHWPIEKYPLVVRTALTFGRRFRLIRSEIFVSEAIQAPGIGTVIPNPVLATAPRGGGSLPNVDLLIVARHSHEKGLDVAIRAMKMLPGRTLTLVGGGPLSDELSKLGKTLDVDERVVFAGFQSKSEVRSYMRACHALLLPSRWEAMPMVLLEAASEEVPMIVSDIDAHQFLIGRGAALGFTPESPQDLARRVNDLASEEILNSLARGRDLLRDEQSEEMVRAKWVGVLLGALPRRALQ
jgi:glycosyltransferase involved in cell wall biosynthesis